MAKDECTVIVAYEVSHEDCDQFLDSWEKATKFLREQAGFVSTALHRAVSAHPDFRFVAVNKWEDADAFRAATQRHDFQEISARLVAFPIHASAYEVVRT